MSDGKKSRIEAEIQRRFRDMYDEYLKDQGEQIPEPDLSFLQEEKPKKRKEHRVLRRFATIAACMVLLLVTSSGMAIWISSDAAHAVKFSLEKTLHRISGTFFSTDDGKEIETEENQISITIDSMDDIQDAVNFMPDLPVPGYIPEGFELETLTVVKYMNGSYTVKYSFINDTNDSFMIISNYNSEADDSVEIVGNAEIIEKNGRKIYFINDFYTSSYNATCFIDNQVIMVMGDLEKNDIVEVAKNISINI